MPRDNAFLTGVLQGLYQGGVGNPDVNERRRANQLEEEKQMADKGMVPIHPHTDNIALHTIKNVLFPGSGDLAGAYQKDPNIPDYAQDPTGKVSMYQPGQAIPQGSRKLGYKEGESALRGQYGKDQTTASKTYTPEQYSAIQSGDDKKIQAAFPNGIPTDAISKENQGLVARSRKDWSQVWKDRLDLQKRVATYGGQFGKNQLSLNTALGHVATASNAYDSIGNMDEKFLNTPINKLKKETNDPNIVSLGISLNALQGELSNVFKGSGATDQEISAWKDYLNEDLTPKQYRAAIDQIGELLNSRIDALQYQQENISPDLPPRRSTLSPNAKKTVNKLNNPLLPKGNGGGDPLGIR